MKEIPKIFAVYTKTDTFLEAERADARRIGDAAKVLKIEQQQLLNDQAYFVLCWGQLEAAIDEACRNAIRKRKKHRDWQMRRGWDIYNPDDKRLSGLSFYERVMFVMDCDADEKAWKLVNKHYETRNKIAHGKLVAARIEIGLIIPEFYTIQAALQA